MTPHEVWLQAVDGQEINLSKLARDLEMRIATLWGYHTGRSRWPAATWVKAMKAVGYDVVVSKAAVPGEVGYAPETHKGSEDPSNA